MSGGLVVARELHRERLLRDGGDPALVDELLREADARAAAFANGMVRVVVTDGSDGSFVEAGPARRRPWTPADPPLSLLVRDDPRTGDALLKKTVERRALSALDDEARALGADGVLLVGPDGALREGTWFAFLLHVDGAWHAPPVGEGVLFSTTRALVSHALAAKGDPLVERTLMRDDLLRADGAAALSSLLGASAIQRVGDVVLRTDASLVEPLLVCSVPPGTNRG